MKPYQFYRVRTFPKLQQGQSVRNQIQLTLFGEKEDVETVLTMENTSFEQSLGLLRIKSEVRHETYGFIRTVVDNTRRKFDFTEYLQPVDFPAFYDEQRGLVLFQAAKKVCRGVIANLTGNAADVGLTEMVVDFSKLMAFCSEYQAAWFRFVSARVRAAGISGEQIQDDALFKKLLKEGELSNVTVPWLLDGIEHRVMITSSAALVLIHDYRDNQGLELQIVTDVYDKLLSKVWEEKKSRRHGAEIPVEP